MEHAQHQPQPQYVPATATAPARVIPFNKRWHTTKIVFMCISMVFCIIVIGVSVAIAVDPSIESLQVLWIAPQAVVAFCWSVAELITLCARSCRRGIHPGAHVALHLLLWLGLAAAMAITGLILGYTTACDYYCYYSYTSHYLTSTQAVMAFGTLLLMIHFFLFVRACVETAQRNRLSALPVVMVPQNVYYAPQTAQYPTQQQMQQQQQQQQQMMPVQPSGGYAVQPQQAHMSTYYGQPKEFENHHTSMTHASQTLSPTYVHEDGLHPVSPHSL